MARVSILLVAILLGVGSLSPAVACDCFGRPVCSSMWEAGVVFVGTATNVSTVARGVEETQFTVDEWLRGEQLGLQVTLRSEGIGISCDYDFEAGVKYLVMASRRNGTWMAFGCGGTRPFPQASSTLDEIHQALRSRDTGTVSGEVFFDAYPDERVGGDTPIVGAPVQLRSARNGFTTVTDAKGGFRFVGVPPGEYELAVRVPPKATAVPPQRLVVGPNACLTRYFFSDPR